MARPMNMDPAAGVWRERAMRAAVAVLVLAVLALIGRCAGAYVPAFARWVQSFGMWGPLIYVLGYVVATVAFVPGALPTLAAGVLFGVFEGTLWAFIGEMLGGAAAFLIARYLARGWVERQLAGSRRFAAIDRAVTEQGLRIIFLLRLSPAIPFNLLNYTLGLTGVRFGDYLLASLGMLPGAMLYVYYGKVAGDIVALAGGAPLERGWEYWALLVFGLGATVAVASAVARLATRALRNARAA